ncbi:MAG: hypothetical protein LBJ47_00285, partial [Tannerella sp.]|nr:hypothetical protein [Tannerella sp.]
MDRSEFRSVVKRELIKLSREEIVYFAWLCAMRALPFLGKYGHFGFWEEKDKQKHLYSVFYALDISNVVGGGVDAYAYAYAAANAANATYAAAAANAATYAANTANAAAYAATYAANAYAAAANAAYAGAAASYRLKEIILKDLKNIKNKIPISNTD